MKYLSKPTHELRILMDHQVKIGGSGRQSLNFLCRAYLFFCHIFFSSHRNNKYPLEVLGIHKFLFKMAINNCYSKFSTTQWEQFYIIQNNKNVFFDWLNGYEMCMFLLNQMCIHYVSKSTKKSQLKNKITIISYTSHTYSKKNHKVIKMAAIPQNLQE